MSARCSRLLPPLLLASATAVAPLSAQSAVITHGPDVKVTHDNFNLPGGTPTPAFDGRNFPQNGTSVAVSPLDPALVAVAMNDYRLLDVDPASLNTSTGNRTWVGLDVSADGGVTFHNTAVPGFFGDTSAAGLASPLRAAGLTGAAYDPIVRFDAAGNLFLMALALIGTPIGSPPIPQSLQPGAAVIFVAKYAYTPRSPGGASTPHAAGDPPSLTYAGTTIVGSAPVGGGVNPSGPVFDQVRMMWLRKPSLAIDTNPTSPYFGSLYATWTPIFAAGLGAAAVLARSTDGGASFTNAHQITQGGELSAGYGFGPFLAVATNGTILVLTPQPEPNPQSGLTRLRVVRSTDGGAHFTNAVTAASIVPIPYFADGLLTKTPTLPKVVFDDTNPLVAYIAYMAMAGSPANADVFVVRTTDGGLSWGPPAKVNDDLTSKHQLFPAIAVSNGVLHVAWYDLRESSSPGNPSVGNDVMHVRYACTNIGGITYPAFSPNVRISDVGQNPSCACVALASFGGYIEMTSRYEAATGRHTAHLAWTDNRDIPPALAGGPLFDPSGLFNTLGAFNMNTYADVITVALLP